MSSHAPKYLLYQKTETIPDQHEVISIIVDSGFTTNGYIHEMRGLAKFAVQDSIRFDRKKNSLEDKLLFSGSPHLQKTSAGDGEGGPKLLPSQGYTVVGRGYQFLPDQPKFDLNNHIVSLNFDEQDYQRETQHYDPSVTGKLTSRPVTSEVDAVRAEVQRIEGSKLNIKLTSYGNLFLGFLRGITKNLDAKMSDKDSMLSLEARRAIEYFRENLMRSLEPINVRDTKHLKKILEKVVALDLQPVLQDAGAIGEQLATNTDTYVVNRLNRMLAFARGFSRKDVKLMYPIVPTTSDLKQQRVAAMENEMLKTTQEVVFDPQDNHINHLDIHIPKEIALVESIPQAEDPIPVFNHLNRLSGHSAFHIDALMRLPYITDATKNKYLQAHKDILSDIAEIKPQIEQFIKNLAAQQQAQAEAQAKGQQQPDPEVMAKIQNDRIKVINDEQIKARRSEFRAVEKQKQSEFDRRLKEERHRQDTRHKEEKARLEKEIEVLRSSINS